MVKQLHRQAKIKALIAFMKNQGRIKVPGDLTAEQVTGLYSHLVEALVDDEFLCGEVLNKQVHLVLHSTVKLRAGIPIFEFKNDDETLWLNIPIKAQNLAKLIKQGIDAAEQQDGIFEKQTHQMPLSNDGKRLNVNKYWGIDEDSRGNPVTPHAGGNRGNYDVRAKELIPYNKKHTFGHILRYGSERSHPNPDCKYVWALDHAYVLSDDALKSKTPGRWFRDLCVVSGVSTNMLEHLTGINQTHWCAVQNGHIKDPSRAMFKALSCVLPKPVKAGRENRGSYFLPAGSLFGIKTVLYIDAKGEKSEKVDPAELNRISTVLFNKPCRSELCVEHILQHIEHMADAYLQGAISREEITKMNVPAEQLKPIFAYFGHNIKYHHSTAENSAISGFLNNYGSDIRPIIETLKTINEKSLHIDKKIFEKYMLALEQLPKGRSACLKALSPREAFTFAKNHHDGRVGGFLRIYREARRKEMNPLAREVGLVKERIRQLELEVSDSTATRRALKDNYWDLPSFRGVIDADVQDYLINFEQHKNLSPPPSHWLTLDEACNQFTADAKEKKKIGPHINTLKQTMDDALKACPQKPYLLVTLPYSETKLLIQNAQGKAPRLLDYEVGAWIREYAVPETMISKPRISRSATIHKSVPIVA